MANWDKIGSRGNVEDRRGINPTSVRGIGTVGILLVIAVGLMGSFEDAVQVMEVLDQVNMTSYQEQVQTSEFEGEDEYEIFASTVLGSSNDLWDWIFDENNIDYQEPRLVLFRDGTSSACGSADARMGPHYCPLDETIYLDERFFDELQSRFGARGGDVAEAYVIAHEVGHHVQKQLGITDYVHSEQKKSFGGRNDLSIQLELQADCLAGMWMNSIADQNIFEPNELLEAIDAAEAVGDDSIQEATQGRVHPETWTHGSSEARKQWLMIGLQNGDFSQCDTFDQ